MSCRHGELSSLYVSWHFYEHKFESKTGVRPPPNYTFDSSHIYVVSIDKQFLMRLQNVCPIKFEKTKTNRTFFVVNFCRFFQEKVPISLYATAGAANILMGSVEINLAEVLLFPQNKIQLTTKVMSVMGDDECDHTDRFCGCAISVAKPKHLGNLTVWFRLTCELDVLKSLFTDFDQWRSQTSYTAAATAADGGDTDATVLGQQQQQKSHSHRSHDDDQKNVTSNHVEPTKSSTQMRQEKNIVTITIECLKFNETFQHQSQNDSAIRIHIECNFLGNRRLKTPPQPLPHGVEQLTFNYTQAYPQNERNLQRLMNVLNDPEHSIKFTLIETNASAMGAGSVSAVHATVPEKSTATVTSDDESKHDCHEIGFGLLHFGKFIHDLDSGSGISDAPHTFTIPILSKKPPYQNIGQLDVAIANIATLKSSLKQQN